MFGKIGIENNINSTYLITENWVQSTYIKCGVYFYLIVVEWPKV